MAQVRRWATRGDWLTMSGVSRSIPMVGRTILHYRIVGMLGAGGMGEVYEAQDLKLDRLVALKFLPPDLAVDAVSLERFQREARAASALNHPAICTIYAFEQAETDEGLRHFIAMERLDGQPLDRLIGGRALPTDAALEIAIHVADALDAAHTRGIVHRDIKPGNIFVQSQNRAKVLDFGLAKLAAARIGVSETMTAEPAERLTNPGVTLGTVAYMSPEQARGEVLDARTDLFSFGAVLYEMCTGRAPFGGKTSAVIFQKILDRDPESPRALNAALPPRLEEIVLKALEKDRDLRCQTAAELRADLKRLQRDSGWGRRTPSPPAALDVPSGGSGQPTAPLSSGELLLSEAKRHKVGLAITAAAIVLLLAAAGFGAYQWMTGGRRAGRGEAMTITRLTSSGQVVGCVSISPDGRNVVFCERDPQLGRDVLRMTQVASGATITLAENTGLTTFSPDGNFVYLRREDPQSYPQGALFQLPAFPGGEEPRRVLTDISGAVAVSQDGQQIAFIRIAIPPQGPPDLRVMITKRDGSEPRVLHSGRFGESWATPSTLSWSPDGRFIAAGYRSRDIGLLMTPVIIDVATGNVRRLTDMRWNTVGRTAWLRDGSGVIVAGLEPGSTQGQLWLVSHPGGEVKRITNDLHHYPTLTVDVDASGTIAARQLVSRGNVWISDAQGNGLQRLTSGSGSDRVLGWIDGGHVLYLTDAPDRSLWSVSLDGTAPKRLPLDAREMDAISLAAGQNWLAYMSQPVPNIWRVNLDGTGRRQITHTGFDRMPRVMPGGGEILYENWSDGMATIWRIPSGGGQPIRLAERVGMSAPSPDGQRFWGLIVSLGSDDSPFAKLGIFRATDGTLERTVDTPSLRGVLVNQGGQWGPDGQSVIYRRSPGGISNLWSLPLSGGEPRQFTNFTSELIFNFAYSPDGQKIAMSRGSNTGDIVLIKNYR